MKSVKEKYIKHYHYHRHHHRRYYHYHYHYHYLSRLTPSVPPPPLRIPGKQTTLYEMTRCSISSFHDCNFGRCTSLLQMQTLLT